MAAVITEDIQTVASRDASPRHVPSTPELTDVEVELGIWLSGLTSFVRSGPNAFFAGAGDDRTRELRVAHSSVQRAAMLTAMLMDPKGDPDGHIAGLPTLASVLRDTILVGDGVLQAAKVNAGAYHGWCGALADRMDSLPVVARLIAVADAAGERNLPPALLRLAESHELDAEYAELALVLPRFGRVLRYLRVVGGMLERDEPLKPAILIFSCVNEMIFDLTVFINSRLERFPDTEAEMFASLDAASYTASMELKKVYAQELAGVSSVRAAPSVYARMETAYALLNDGFQLILAGFTTLIEAKSDMFAVFPEFKAKRDHSIALRRGLNDLIKAVQAAETAPDERKIGAMNSAIREFMLETVTYLFYKDTETVERFVEEITMTRNNQDLVPLLHRFGAYLDTLLGQVSLRAVLSE